MIFSISLEPDKADPIQFNIGVRWDKLTVVRWWDRFVNHRGDKLNEQNLTHFGDEVPSDRHRVLSRKGGKASVASRARKKKIRDLLSIIVQAPADKTAVEKLKALGVEDVTQEAQMLFNLVNRAKRSNSATALVAELLGERPKDITRKEQLRIDRARLKLEREKISPSNEPSEDLHALLELLQKDLKTVMVRGFNGEEIELTSAEVRYLVSQWKIKDGRFIDPLEGDVDEKQ